MVARQRKGKDTHAAVLVSTDPYAISPACPKRLRGAAKEYWDRIAPLLTAKRVLTPLHLEALETLCDAWGTYRRLSDWLAADPSRWTFETAAGYEQEAPQVRLLGGAVKELLRLWAHFGLTPHSEARLVPRRGGQVSAADPAAALMAAAGEKTRDDEAERPPRR
jgi:P27 family predicted phage terminase small subunit